MVFVKVVKTRAYFKRFQVKYRRRREGKTDYRARRRLIIQDRNKYNTPKYRFVVRITNKDVICQIVYSKLVGDIVVTAAYSHELKRYGWPVPFTTNYAACYATGLLLARRHLTKIGLADSYRGRLVADGRDYLIWAHKEGPRPFKAFLDVGLRRTSTGARIFGAMKGALDGGVNIPHNKKRFFGYNNEANTFSDEALKKVIYGGHVADYMRSLHDDDSKAYEKKFSAYIKAGVEPDQVQELWGKVHANIRADPKAVLTVKKVPEKQRTYVKQPMSLIQRVNRRRQKILTHKFKRRQAAKKAEEGDAAAEAEVEE
jgi:large subunit ribosomal protein L5e